MAPPFVAHTRAWIESVGVGDDVCTKISGACIIRLIMLLIWVLANSSNKSERSSGDTMLFESST